DHRDRDVVQCRRLLELIEEEPAVHIRQADVERDRVRTEAPRQRQDVGAAGGDDALEAFLTRQVEQDRGELAVILDDEHDAVAGREGIAIVRQFARGRDIGRRAWRHDRLGHRVLGLAGRLQRQIEREDAALARHALDLDRPAEQAGDLAADRQAEAGAAKFAAGGAVGLLESLEDDAVLVAGDADAGIGDGEGDDIAREAAGARHTGTEGETRDLERDAAALGEFKRVGQQILQYLLQPLMVGAQARRQRFVDKDGEGEALFLGQLTEAALDIVAQIVERYVADVDTDRAGFDLREIEDVVDQGQQVDAG